jgi:hypothetical protein
VSGRFVQVKMGNLLKCPLLQTNTLADKWILSWILDPYDEDKKMLLWTLSFLFMNAKISKEEEGRIVTTFLSTFFLARLAPKMNQSLGFIL